MHNSKTSIQLKTIMLTLSCAALMTACTSSSSGSSDTNTGGTTSSAPVVNAGSPQSVTPGAAVTLNSTATDSDGDALTYTWSQTSGTSVTLSSTSAEDPTFTAPSVTSSEDLVFSLSVSDGTNTTADTVTITVDPAAASSSSPAKQVVAAGGTATLSVDTGTTTNVYSWIQTSGTAVTLMNATTDSPSFIAPSLTTSEILTFDVTYDPQVTETKSIYVYAPPAYDAGMENVGNFTDFSEWACTVQPSLSHSVSITESGGIRTISGNGIPDNAIGTFPNAGNPNTVAEVSVNYQVTTTPVKTTTASEMNEFGVLLNGAKLERDTAERYPSGSWNYEAITQGIEIGDFNELSSLSSNWLGTDCNNAHVQPTGHYHHHGFPEAYMQKLVSDAGVTDGVPTEMVLAGYAADGFAIYFRYGHTDASDSSSALKAIEHSWVLKSGTRSDGPGGTYDGTFRQDWEYQAGNGDTDQCGGRTGVTPQSNGQDVYHYFITTDYPFIPRCVFGTPNSSFRGRN